MAFEIPQWLNTGPTNSISAAQAGAQIGLGMAQNKLRAREQTTDAALKMAQMQMQRDLSNQENARRAWEFEQTLRERAAQNAAERELASAQLGESQRYHMAGSELGLGKLAAQEAYNEARLGLTKEGLDIKRLAATGKGATTRNVGGQLYEQDPATGKWVVVIPKDPKSQYATPASVFQALVNPVNQAGYRRAYGSDALKNALAYGQTAIPGGGGTGVPPVFGSSPDGSTGWYDAITGDLIQEISPATNSPSLGPPKL